MPARMEESSEFKKIWFKIIQAYYVLTDLVHFIIYLFIIYKSYVVVTAGT